MPFVLEEGDVSTNPSGWGPSAAPAQFVDIPFALYEKRTFIGRSADWSARAEQYREQRMRNRPKEAANEAFVAAADDTEGFQLVDTQANMPQPQWDKGMRGRGGRGRGFGRGRGRFASAPPMGEEAKFNAKFFAKKTVTAPVSKWKKNQQANYGQQHRWNDQKPVRTRESSVDVRPEWVVKGQITFPELQKLTVEVPAGESVYTSGSAHYYEKAYDRVNPKAEKGLVAPEGKVFYSVTTSDDPTIAKLHDDPKLKDVRVFATDAILSVIMAAPRSAFSWDLIVNRVGDKLFLDKRSDAPTDYVTCMETANDFGDDDKESINHPSKLMAEATYINQAFSQQVLSRARARQFEEPRGPFASAEETPAPVSYRYRTFTLGKKPKDGEDDKRVTVLCRCELDASPRASRTRTSSAPCRSTRSTPSVRRHRLAAEAGLAARRGARQRAQEQLVQARQVDAAAMLAGADLIKYGFVSRVNPKTADRHVLLATGVYKPNEFAPLINLNLMNAWGILKAVIDLCLSLEEGKYLLLKDPNKPVVRFYSVPTDAFDEAEEPEPLPEEEEED